ncbi:MAG: glycosyltransferase family 2 protein [Lachnospiraceae bacterium]|nr:glycosyltransferase family 2 protein [Lachnospiraceae bacterium]
MSTVNIAMATYNGSAYLREQLDSILSSTYTDWSLAIFDDMSTDDTVSIAREYAGKYPERIFVYEAAENKGSTVNFLEGLKKMYRHSMTNEASEDRTSFSSNRAKYFMFADQDDVWLKDKIEITLQRMKSMEKKFGRDVPALCYTDAVVVDSNLHFMRKSFHSTSHLKTRKNDLAHLLMENKCMGCTMMMNAALVELLDEIPLQARYHDWWMVLLAAAFGKVRAFDEQTLLYRQHGDNQVGSTGFVSYIFSRLTSVRRQREKLRQSFAQAEALLELYGDRMDFEKRRIVREFARLDSYGFIRRRRLLLKNRYFKSGLLRNIGLFLII